MKYCINAWNWRDSRTVSIPCCPECPVIMIIYLLVLIGPRFVLNPIKIFAGSFGGATLWANPDYQSPNLASCGYHCFTLPTLCKWIKLHTCCFMTVLIHIQIQYNTWWLQSGHLLLIKEWIIAFDELYYGLMDVRQLHTDDVHVYYTKYPLMCYWDKKKY